MAFLFFILSIISPPSWSFDPARSWFTLETDNFSIYFSVKGELTGERIQFARDVAGVAEEVRKTLWDSLKIASEGKVHLILVDFLDHYNGLAVPFPENTIIIMPTPPAGAKTNDDNWLRTLILHEYSHILQLQQVGGVNKFLRSIFGKVVLPNALLPAWVWEGYAVYNESRFSNFGRLRSAEWQMMLRAAVKENRFLPIDRCNGYELQNYPSGNAPYLYGSWFFHHLAQQNNKINNWEEFNFYNSRQVPFFENRVSKKIFGATFPQIWQKWQKEVGVWADSVEKEIRKKPITNLKRLTYQGFNISSPSWSHNRAEIYYISETGREEPAIKALNPGTLTTRVLYRGGVKGNLGVSREGRFIAFAQYLLTRNGYDQTDIFLLDLETKKAKRLTFNERAQDPDFSPDGDALVYVRNRLGKSELVILNLANGIQTVIAEGEDVAVYHQPKFSPGGRLIAVGVWRPNGYADIEVIDREGGWTIPITQDRANDISPVWSRTGKFLFFVSDRNGVYNLYAYGVETKKLYRCTNVLYGVFEPTISPNNRQIALVSYSADGYDISVMELRAQEWREAEEFIDQYPEIKPAPVSFHSEIYYYHPYPTLLPRFWLPWISLSPERELGAFVLGWDVLQFHKYWAKAGYQMNVKKPFFSFSYELHRYRPVFLLDGDFKLDELTARFGVNLPFYTHRWSQNFGSGIKFQTDRGTRVLFDWYYNFTSARTFRFCVAPVQGREFGLFAGAEKKSLSGTKDQFRLIGYWNEFLGRPPAPWSGKVKLALGAALGDSSRLNAFQLSNGSGVWSVRGYPVSESLPFGASIVVGGVEFRMPLFWLERGIATLPIFFRNLNTALFWDIGTATASFFGKENSIPWRSGVGTELRFDFLFAHYLSVNFALGAAVGVTPKLNHQFYLRVESEMFNSLARDTPSNR